MSFHKLVEKESAVIVILPVVPGDVSSSLKNIPVVFRIVLLQGAEETVVELKQFVAARLFQVIHGNALPILW